MNATRRGAMLSGLVLTAPLWAQSPPRIVFIWPGSVSGEEYRSAAFKQGMDEIGMVHGRDYQLEEHYADGQYERFPAITAAVLQRPPALLMVVTISSVRAAQQATQTVPIVFVSTNDPVGSGLVASLARPGGNTTGLSTQNEDTAIKLLQLTHEVLPRVRRIAVLVNPANPSGSKLFEQMRAPALALGIEAVAHEARSPQALDAAFAAINRQRAEVLLVIPDSMFGSEVERIAAFAQRTRLPFLATNRKSASAGAVLTYGLSNLAIFRRSAVYAKKILEGAKPGDLPVEQPTRFELIINLKTATALGIAVPQALLLRADEVIQ